MPLGTPACIPARASGVSGRWVLSLQPPPHHARVCCAEPSHCLFPIMSLSLSPPTHVLRSGGHCWKFGGTKGRATSSTRWTSSCPPNGPPLTGSLMTRPRLCFLPPPHHRWGRGWGEAGPPRNLPEGLVPSPCWAGSRMGICTRVDRSHSLPPLLPLLRLPASRGAQLHGISPPHPKRGTMPLRNGSPHPSWRASALSCWSS